MDPVLGTSVSAITRIRVMIQETGARAGNSVHGTIHKARQIACVL